MFGCNVLMTSLFTCYGARGGGKSMFLFNGVVKNHYMAHIAVIPAYINPRLGWTFLGEDLMQIVRRVGGQCSRGTLVEKIGKKFMDFYLSSWGLCCPELSDNGFGMMDSDGKAHAIPCTTYM